MIGSVLTTATAVVAAVQGSVAGTTDPLGRTTSIVSVGSGPVNSAGRLGGISAKREVERTKRVAPMLPSLTSGLSSVLSLYAALKTCRPWGVTIVDLNVSTLEFVVIALILALMPPPQPPQLLTCRALRRMDVTGCLKRSGTLILARLRKAIVFPVISTPIPKLLGKKGISDESAEFSFTLWDGSTTVLGGSSVGGGVGDGWTEPVVEEEEEEDTRFMGRTFIEENSDA